MKTKVELCVLGRWMWCLFAGTSVLHGGTQDVEEQIAILGENVGQPVDAGFFFIDGTYVDSPYRVSRRGLAVLVNGYVVVPPVSEWPPPDLAVVEDPGIPEGLTEQSRFADIERSTTTSAHDAPLYRKMRYINQHSSGEEAVDAKIAWYRSLPFVASVKRLDSKRVEVRTKSGEVRRIWAGSSGAGPGVSATPTKEQVAAIAEGQRSWFEAALRDGKCVIKLRNGGHIIMKADVARSELPAIVTMLQSNRSRAEKIRSLEGLEGMSASWKEASGTIVDTFSVTPQLHQRLREIEGDAVGEN